MRRVIMVLGVLLVPALAGAQTLTLGAVETSSSGRTTRRSGSISNWMCNKATCTEHFKVILDPPGHAGPFTDAEIHLNGFEIARPTGTERLENVQVTVVKTLYNPAGFTFEFDALVSFERFIGAADPVHFTIYFEIVEADAAETDFIPVVHNCTSPSVPGCDTQTILPGVIPPGFELVGIPMRSFTLTSSSGPLRIRGMWARMMGTVLAGGDLQAGSNCLLTDASYAHGMRCSTEGVAIAVDASVVDPNHHVYSTYVAPHTVQTASFVDLFNTAPVPHPGVMGICGLEGFTLQKEDLGLDSELWGIMAGTGRNCGYSGGPTFAIDASGNLGDRFVGFPPPPSAPTTDPYHAINELLQTVLF